jgi:ABC-type sugar transport system permease subunit
MKKGGHIAYILILPALIFFLLFTVWPIIEVVRLSVVRTNFITTQYIGFSNFIDIMRDAEFRQSMVNSLYYIILLTPMNTGFALIMALWAHRLSKNWQNAARIIFYIPTLVAGIIIAQVWKWVFDDSGPINWFFELIHIGHVSWFAQGITAIPTIVFIIAFSSVGGNFIILLSAILGIDGSIFEAARMDGCNHGLMDRKIIMPIIRPTIIMVAFLSAIQGPCIFETIYSLAPQAYAATIAYNIYLQGFQYSKYGMASAQSIILLVIMVALSGIRQKVAK